MRFSQGFTTGFLVGGSWAITTPLPRKCGESLFVDKVVCFALKKCGRPEKRTPAAKAVLQMGAYGTAEAVPLSKAEFFSIV